MVPVQQHAQLQQNMTSSILAPSVVKYQVRVDGSPFPPAAVSVELERSFEGFDLVAD